jgi:dihydroneopterin aldolase
MSSELYRVAIHEAGHAVGALRMGISFDRVTIKPDGDTLGLITPDSHAHYNPRVRADGMANAIFSLAGCVAEVIHGYDDCEDGASGDFTKSEGALRAAFKTEKEISIRRYRAWSKTFKMLAEPKTWALVEAIATALVEQETLSFEDVAWIIEEQSTKK